MLLELKSKKNLKKGAHRSPFVTLTPGVEHVILHRRCCRAVQKLVFVGMYRNSVSVE